MTDSFQSDTRSLHSGIITTGTNDNLRSRGSNHRLIIPPSGGKQTAVTLFYSIGQVHAGGWHIPCYHDLRNEGYGLADGMAITFERFTSAGAPEGVRVTADGRLACY